MSVTFWGSVPRSRVLTLMRLSGISTTCTVGRSGVATRVWSYPCWWFYLKPIEGATVAPLRLIPHDSRPKPSNAAALFKQEEAATSAAGAWDFDSSGSDATAE